MSWGVSSTYQVPFFPLLYISWMCSYQYCYIDCPILLKLQHLTRPLFTSIDTIRPSVTVDEVKAHRTKQSTRNEQTFLINGHSDIANTVPGVRPNVRDLYSALPFNRLTCTLLSSRHGSLTEESSPCGTRAPGRSIRGDKRDRRWKLWKRRPCTDADGWF